MDSDASIVSVDDQKFGIQNSHQGSAMCERIQGLLKELTVSNVQSVADQILKLNLIKGRGRFCEAIMESQMGFPGSSSLYAAVVAVINSEFPDVGLLLVKRAVLQFKQAYECSKKEAMGVTLKLLAHLVNQAVVYETLALDILMLFLGNPSCDNVELAVDFCMECGSTLLEFAPRKMKGVMGEFRHLLHEGAVKKGVEGLIVKILDGKNLGSVDYPGVVDELGLVEVWEGVTHQVSLVHDIDAETSVDGLCFDEGEVSEDDEVCS